MSRIIYNTATSLDGFIADPDDSLEWLFSVGQSPEAETEQSDFDKSVGAFVEGSTTYEWVLRETGVLDEPRKWQQLYGDRPTFVFTTRDLPRPEGADVRFVSGALLDHLGDLRTAAGDGHLWVVGGGDLAGQFLDVDALDEIRVLIAPVTLGAGAPLLPRRIDASRLTLTESVQHGQFAALRYAVTRSGGEG